MSNAHQLLVEAGDGDNTIQVAVAGEGCGIGLAAFSAAYLLDVLKQTPKGGACTLRWARDVPPYIVDIGDGCTHVIAGMGAA